MIYRFKTPDLRIKVLLPYNEKIPLDVDTPNSNIESRITKLAEALNSYREQLAANAWLTD